jgi:hypothetical protein
MASMQELYAALQKADAAGDTESAKQIAAYIKSVGTPAAYVAPEGPKKEKGLWASLKSGTEGALSSGAAGLETFLGDGTAAGKRANLRDEERDSRYENEVSREKVGAAYDKAGLYGGAKEVLRQAPHALAQFAPVAGTMLAGGKLGGMGGTAVAGPVGGVVGAIGGSLIAPLLMGTGENVARQTEVNPDKEVNTGAAIAGGAVSAALDRISLGMMPGLRGMLGPIAKDVGKVAAEKILQQTARQAAADYLKSGAKSTLAEATTEALQSAITRLQAGQSLTDANARKEYYDSLYAGALTAGTVSPAGRYVERGQIAEKEADEAKAEKIAAAKAQQEALVAQRKALQENAANESTSGPAVIDAVDNSDPNPSQAIIKQRLEAASQGQIDARNALDAALRSGDTEAATAARAAAAEYKATIGKLSGLVRNEPPKPPEKSNAELQAELAELVGTTNKKGNPVPGKALKAHIAGNDALYEQFTTRAQEIRDILEARRQADLAPERNAPAAKEALEGGDTTYKTSLDIEREQPTAAGTTAEDTSGEGRAYGEQKVDETAAKMAEGRLNTTRTDQRTLFDTDTSATVFNDSYGKDLGGKSLAEMRADYQIAFNTGNLPLAAKIREAIRDKQADALKEDTGRDAANAADKDAPASSTLDTSGAKALREAFGTKLPSTVAQGGAAQDARNTSYGKLVQLLNRFNKGAARQEEVDTARETVVSSLIDEINAGRTTPLGDQEAQAIRRQAESELRQLINRFGDTRSGFDKGTKKNPMIVPAQRRDGTWSTEKRNDYWPGYPSVEMARDGQQTFANPFEAAQGIKKSLDELRNTAIGTRTTQRIERTYTPENTSPEALQQALAQAQPTTVAQQNLLAQIEDNLPALSRREGAADDVAALLYAMRTGKDQAAQARVTTGERRGNQTPDDIRAKVEGHLRALEEGKRSETEDPTRTRETAFGTARGEQKPLNRAEQGDLFDNTSTYGETTVRGEFPMKSQTVNGQPQQVRNFDGKEAAPVSRGAIFNSPQEFFNYLGGEALRVTRQAMGLTTQTLQRALRLLGPTQKKIDQLTASMAVEQEKYDAKVAQIRANQAKERGAAAQESEAAASQIATSQMALNAAEKAHEVAMNRFRAVWDKYNKELLDARIQMQKAQDAMAFEWKTFADINDAIITNTTGLAAANQAAVDTRKEMGRRALELRIVLGREVTHENYAQAKELQRDIARLHSSLELQESKLPEVVAAHNKLEARLLPQRTDAFDDLYAATEGIQRAQENLNRIDRNRQRRTELPKAQTEVTRTMRESERLGADVEAARKIKEEADTRLAAAEQAAQGPVALPPADTEELRGQRYDLDRLQAEKDKALGPVFNLKRKGELDRILNETSSILNDPEASAAARADAKTKRDAAYKEWKEVTSTQGRLGVLEARDARTKTGVADQDLDARNGRQRESEQAMMERLAAMPTDEVTFEALRKARENAASPERKAALERAIADPETSEASRKKFQTELNKVNRAQQFIDNRSGEGNIEAGAKTPQRLEMEQELERLRYVAPTKPPKGTELSRRQKALYVDGTIEATRKKIDTLEVRIAKADKAKTDSAAEDPPALKTLKGQLTDARKTYNEAVKRAETLEGLLKNKRSSVTRKVATKEELRTEAEAYLLADRAEAIETRGTTQGDPLVRGEDGRYPDRPDEPDAEGNWSYRPALQPGRVSVASRNEITPGDQRTGTEESKGLRKPDGTRGAGENKTGTRNPVGEQRRVTETNRAISKTEQEQANKDAAAIGAKSETTDLGGVAEGEARLAKDRARVMEQEIPSMERMLEEARERSESAESAQNTAPERRKALQERVTFLEEKLQAHRDEIARLRKEPEAAPEAVAEVLQPAPKLKGKNVTTLQGTDFVGENENYESGNLYRTATSTGAGMKVAEVTRLVNRMTDTWTNMPETEVVATEADLPPYIQEQAERDGMTGKIPGVYDTNSKKVYLVAENLRTGNDVVLTVIHEVAGHYGMRDLLGKDYESFMNRMYNGNADVKAKADARMKANKNLSKEVAVEEVLADMAETSEGKSGLPAALSRFFYAMKMAIKKFFGNTNITDNEIRQVVANARRHVKRGKAKGDGATTGGGAFRAATAADYGAYADYPGKAEEDADNRTFRDKYLKNFALEAEFRLADMHAYAIEALRRIGSSVAQQAEFDVRASGNTTSLLGGIVQHGAPEFRKHANGQTEIVATDKDSLGDFFSAVAELPMKDTKAKYELLTDYMAAIRGLRVGSQRLGKTKAQLQERIDYVRSRPELFKAAENARAKFNAYNEKLVATLLDSGAITPAEAKSMTEHGDYVPFYRRQGDKIQLMIGNDFVSMGDISHTPFVHALKGSEEAILPLSESAFENSRLLLQVALTNQAKRNIAHALAEAGAGKGGGIRSSGAPTDKMWIRDDAGPAKSEVLRWKEGGKDKHLVIDTEGTLLDGIPTNVLVQSIEGFHATIPSYLKFAKVANDMLRAGITRMPMYTLRQLVRDPMAAAAVVGIKGGPLVAVARAFGIYGNVMIGRKSDTVMELEKRGLVQNNLFTGDPDDMAMLAKQMAGGEAPTAIRKFLNFLDKSAFAADAATRAQIWDTAKGRGLSDVEAAHLVRESMNFSKRGIDGNVQIANRALLFFNSGVQGINAAQMALRGKMPFEEQLKHKQRYIRNFMMLGVMGALYSSAMAGDDDEGHGEEYRNLKMNDKIGNIHFRSPDGTLYKLPLSYFESGGAAWALGQALVAGYGDHAETEHIVKSLRRYALSGFPGGGGIPMIPGFKQAIEWGTGVDLRTLDKIVPASVAGNTPANQYTVNTPTALRAIGEAADISPAKLDHLLSTIFGPVLSEGLMILDQIAPVTGEEKSALPENMVPFFRSLVQNPESVQAMDEVYAKSEKARAANTTFSRMENEGVSASELNAFIKKHGVDLAMAKTLGSFAREMGEIRAEIARIENRPASEMGAEEKAAEIKKLKQQRAELAKNYNAAAKDIEAQLAANAV